MSARPVLEPENKKKRFVVVGYKMGNLQSVLNALHFLGCSAVISDQPDDIRSADALILPGVGAFGEAMKNLQSLGLVDALTRRVVEEKTPFLGICLGMQLIAESSEEHGKHTGMGWIPGQVRRLAVDASHRVPHVGWNDTSVKPKAPLFANLEGSPDFYYVHSYQFECDELLVAATCDYGGKFTAAVQKDNILAVQFHPEKSQHNGLKVLRNFTNFAAAAGGTGC